MIYQDTKRFLKNHLGSAKIDQEWGFRDNLALFNILESRYTQKELSLNTSEIKEAFRDFFEPVCKVVVDFSVEKGVAFKCFAYRVEPKESKHLRSLVNIIQTNHKYIEYPYQGKNDLICLLGGIRRRINQEIVDSHESINKKALIKQAIIQALELSDRDVVFYLKRKYLVKIFDKNLYLSSKENIAAPRKRDLTTEKFNGFDEEELESHYYMLFEDIDIDQFLDLVVSEFFVQKISFKTLDGTFFETQALRVIRDVFADELTNHTQENKEYLIGFAGYIFRRHFEDMFVKIAAQILQEIASDNKEAIEFLRYYSGEIILVDGVKYKIPSLEKEDGSRWNVQSAIAISNMWIKTKQKMDKMVVSLKDISEKIKPLAQTTEVLAQISEQKEQLKKELSIITQEIEQRKYNTQLIKQFQSDSEEFARQMQQIKAKESALKQKIEDLNKTQEQITEESKSALTEKKKLELQAKNIQNSINGLEQNLKANSKLYESILSSLANALIKKKQRL
jgi:hypothetical protein